MSCKQKNHFLQSEIQLFNGMQYARYNHDFLEHGHKYYLGRITANCHLEQVKLLLENFCFKQEQLFWVKNWRQWQNRIGAKPSQS